MRRTILALGSLVAGACLALLTVMPAGAQTYGGGGGNPPANPPGPPQGCPVQDPPPDAPPCHPRERATVSDRTVQPGQQITVSTPPVFAPNTPVEIQIVHVTPDSAPVAVPGDDGATTTDGSGAVSEQITIPTVPRGTYFLYVVGQDTEGEEVVAIVPIVIRPAATSAQVPGGARAASVQGDSVIAVPAAVAALQQDLAPEADAAVVDLVSQGQAGLVLSPSGVLQVRTPEGTQRASQLPTTGNDIATQVTAGSALLLAGTGMVLLRRRRSVRS